MSSISVAKHSYIKAGPKAKATAKAHVNYVQHRSGHDKNQGQPREFFDKDNDQVEARSVRARIDCAADRGVIIHKLVLSPGVQGVDLQQYTRSVMEEIGDRKGLDLDWKAVIHANTDHAHAHVIVMGRDRDGRTVRFDRHDYQDLRDIGDKYLERRHEFDRYFDRTLDNVLKEGNNRGFDLENLFKPFDLDYNEKSKSSKGQSKSPVKDHDLHEKPQATRLPNRRKPRRQRVFEARGRQDSDYFHDLYQRNTSRERLERLVNSDPEKSGYYQNQLAFLDQIDADRRADALQRSGELDRILGIHPTQSKEKRAVPAAAQTESDAAPALDMDKEQSKSELKTLPEATLEVADVTKDLVQTANTEIEREVVTNEKGDRADDIERENETADEGQAWSEEPQDIDRENDELERQRHEQRKREEEQHRQDRDEDDRER